MVTAAMKLGDTCFLEGKYEKPRERIKKQKYHFADNDPYNQSYGFSSIHLWMQDLDNKKTQNKKRTPRINTFKLWCWRRLLGVLWTARSN